MVGSVFTRVGATIGVTLAALTQQALAQQVIAAAERQEKIEVTGSRIATSDVESVSPIAIISADVIKAEGYQSLELILNNFPQLMAGQGGRINNLATGTATADLRGLFPERTLVLLNGRRLMAGSPYLLAADLNQIPVPLISRVEVLTGGASAVYGSDAIAGVINIILDDRFDGFQGDISYDFFNHRQQNAAVQELLRARNFPIPGDQPHDGATTSASVAVGRAFAADKGHAMAFLRYAKIEPVSWLARDYSSCGLSVDDVNAPTTVFCGGSFAGFPGRFIDFGSGRVWTPADGSGGVRAFNPATDRYNVADGNYFQRPGERYGFNAFAHYDVHPAMRVYGEFGFHDDRTTAQLARTAVFGGVFAIRYENPLLSDDWRSRLIFTNPEDGSVAAGPGSVATLLIQRRNVEGQFRQENIEHRSYRYVFGAKGEIVPQWDYDVSAVFGRVNLDHSFTHDFSTTRVARALDVVTDPATGLPACASVLNGTDRNCVPYNIWRQGGVTPQAIAYLDEGGFSSGATSQQSVAATISTELARYGMRSPWARSGMEVAFGAERRTDRMQIDYSASFANDDLESEPSSKPSVKGRVSVSEVYAEARLPILDTLLITGSYRYSDYDIGKTTDSFGVGFNAVAVEKVRLRGSYQRAVRAPNILELFSPQTATGWGFPDGARDPCVGTTPTRSLAECARTGVTPAQYGHIPDAPADGGYAAIKGGNPDVAPESATTYTAGFVVTPAKNLSVTLDYFDIRVDDFIYDGTPEVTFQRCIDTGDPSLCRLITRDPVRGSLWLPGASVLATNQNIGRVHVSGADVAATYRHALGGGHSVDLNGIGSYIRSYTWEPYRGAMANQCAGHFAFNCNDPRPKWRSRMRTTWLTPWNAELSLTWRHVDSVTNQNPLAVVRTINSVDYFDLAGSWSLDKRLTVRAGVGNVADRDPPIIVWFPPANNGNTFAQVYDALGRHVFVNLTARF